MFKSTLTPRIQPNNRKKGVIVRLSCRNFITYGEVEVCPGEDLNIILGPNGSGKSTIVNAIILGLAGKTKLIGRAEDLLDYIKLGQKFFEIEIELNNPDGKNFIISRKYTREKESTWMLNGAKVTQKKIETIVKECKIQIDNLCQFLPQDRVQDFAKMNAVELLEQTQRSIDNGELAEQLSELKAQRVDQIEVQKELGKVTEDLGSEVQKNASLEGEVRTAAEREDLTKKIERMKQKQAFLLIETTKQLVNNLKTELTKKRKEKEDTVKIEEDMQKQIAAAKRQQAHQDNTLTQQTSAARSQLIGLNTLLNQTADIADRIEDEKNDLRIKLRKEENRLEEIRTIDVHIERLMNDLPNSDGSDEQELEAVSAQIQEKKSNEGNLMEQIEDIGYGIRNKEHEIRVAEGRIAAENNANNANMEHLREHFRGVHDAVIWLRKNRHQFQGEVFEPMFTQINVQEGYAKFIENAVAGRDLLAFTCEYNADTTKLINELKTKQKLHGINIITAPEKIMNGNKEVLTKDAYRPYYPLEQITRFGFQQYLLNVVDGPEPILRLLAKNFNLHNIPVGNNLVNRNVDHIPAEISLYFSDDSRYNVRTSKYSGKKLFSNSAVNNARLLRNNVNHSRLQEYESQQQQLRSEKENLLSRRSQLSSQLTSVKAELNALNGRKNQLKQKTQQEKMVKTKIEQKRKRRQELEQSRSDPESAQLNFQETAKRLVQDFLRAKNNIVRASSNIEHASEEIKLHKLVLTGLKDKVRSKERALREYKKSYSELSERIRQLEESIQDEKENHRRQTERAVQLCKGVKPGSAEFQLIQAEFDTLPNDSEELDSNITETQARVDILAGTSNSNSVREYEKRKKKIRELEKDKDTLQNRLDEIAGKMGVLRERWYPRVKDLINKIDSKFREYFASFNCEGRVELYEGENENNFEKYGIRIMVRFRDNSELQPLDSHTQSGGERAVSTAVYMLSLQELTDVPFRVVDEINQGMDSSNERRVFDLLVSTISTANSAQYFLLTPKLLDNLEYSEVTTILNVHNGPYAMHYGLWDVKKFIENRSHPPTPPSQYHPEEYLQQSERRRMPSESYSQPSQHQSEQLAHHSKRRRMSPDLFNDENQDTNTMR